MHLLRQAMDESSASERTAAILVIIGSPKGHRSVLIGRDFRLGGSVRRRRMPPPCCLDTIYISGATSCKPTIRTTNTAVLAQSLVRQSVAIWCSSGGWDFGRWRLLRLPNLGNILPKMGRQASKATGLASALFSQVQLRVLSLLIGQPDRHFHASELIRLAGSGSGAVQRELEKLANARILNVTVSGNRKLYQANRQSPIFGELHGLIVKTAGLVEPIRRALKSRLSNIDVAFVYGSIAKGEDSAKSDIDLMIIGQKPTYSEIYTALQKAEKILLRPVNPTLMTPVEWKQKVADQNSFVRKVLQQPKLFVFGTENELKGIGQSR